MDTLFLETCEFKVARARAACCLVAPSREEVLRQLMAEAGLELIDYGSFVVRTAAAPRGRDALEAWDQVSAYSTAYRERAERAAARR